MDTSHHDECRIIKKKHVEEQTYIIPDLVLERHDAADDRCLQADKKPVMLAIYVYAPEQAAAAQKKAAQTRGDVGKVDAINDEGTIKSLQLWIYESDESTFPGKYVGYLSTEDVASLNTGEGTTYQIPVSDDFASRKPSVDVYVQANVKAANCGVGTLNEETTRANLLTGAKITGHFGLGNLQTSVPTDGLPMAGYLTNCPWQVI